MKVFVFNGNTTEHVIAADAADALAILVEVYDAETVSDSEFDDPVELPDDANIRVDIDGDVSTRTAAEWVGKFGRGQLCSSEY